jgi:ferredoxin-NADP reductase
VTWRPGTVTAMRAEAAAVRTLTISVPGWSPHVPGQHVDVRLTAPDGYTATRPYSIGSVPGAGSFEISVDRVPDGEVSSYLAGEAAAGAVVEIRGPLGGWFLWREGQHEPVQLVGGGSGLVPLMSMIRAHDTAAHPARMQLLYAARDPDSVLYRDELSLRARTRGDVTVLYSRRGAPDDVRAPGRVTAAEIEQLTLGPGLMPSTYVCGPTAFVESVLTTLVGLGHDPGRVKAERFG